MEFAVLCQCKQVRVREESIDGSLTPRNPSLNQVQHFPKVFWLNIQAPILQCKAIALYKSIITEITIAPSVDKGWIVIWINIVYQGRLASTTVLVKRLEVSWAKIARNLLNISHIWPRALMRTSWNFDYVVLEIRYLFWVFFPEYSSVFQWDFPL